MEIELEIKGLDAVNEAVKALEDAIKKLQVVKAEKDKE